MNNSDLKALKDLEGFTFVIPSYQRGYRWTRVEIERLLDDIYEFAQGKSNATYYPLQPIVVKKADERYNNLCGNDNKDKCYVLIDGQQRMTTLYLIIKALKELEVFDREPPYAIVYETREKSKEFLKDISSKSEKDAKENPDFHYMWKAYETIKDWLSRNLKKDEDKIKIIADIILPGDRNRNKVVKIIWYEIGEDENEEAVFIRLNAGKIPLTDTELIRGYLLQEKNWKNKEERQRIAREWDLIQMALEDDSFWYFLAGKTEMSKEEKYETRMDFLFEIMLGVKRDERYTLFSEFISKSTGEANNNGQEESSEKNSINGQESEKVNSNKQEKDPKEKVRERWKEIQKIYSYLRYFYENNELYHLIGFLTSIEKEPYRVFEEIYSKMLKEDEEGKKDKDSDNKMSKRDDMIRYIRKGIKDKMALRLSDEICKDEENKKKECCKEGFKLCADDAMIPVRNLKYNEHHTLTHRTLLLFNILTAMDSKHYRFPFDLYHKEEWSLEHIHARNDKGFRDNKDWIKWFDRNLSILKKLYANENRQENNNKGGHKKNLVEKIENVLGFLCESYIKDKTSPEKEIWEICCESPWDENNKKCDKLRYTTGDQSPNDEALKKLMDEIFDFFDEYAQQRSEKSEKEIEKEYGTHDISNLALLSKKKNSALGNQTFAAKRQIIIEMDKNGEFIPPATRNAFLKYYTEEPDDLLVWHIKDRKAYEDAIVERLSKFLNEIPEEGGEHEQQG